MAERKPVTVPELIAMKGRGERIAVVTAYDYPSALLADQAGVDAILVGDSLGMVVLGYQNTVPVTMEEMLHHVRAVTRARTKALVVADLPFLSFQAGPEDAIRNAGRLLKEGGATAVKLEGGAHVTPTVGRMVSAGIPVMGHLGLTPQSINRYGGFRAQAKEPKEAKQLLEEAHALERAGAFALVLEAIPAEVARAVSQALKIPSIGIGAGPDCDGEVQVWHDLLGLGEFLPRHSRRFTQAGDQIREALRSYLEDVRARRFPTEENTLRRPELEDPETWK
jgi:3-methyl-2-oxobutanoate hydroxymethyltransferase